MGAAATAIALMLGTLASFAVSALPFFGRETVSFLVVLPIALPGIVTGFALSDTFTQVLGVDLGLHRDRRPRHLLHRRRLQQRDRPAARVSATSRKPRPTSARTPGNLPLLALPNMRTALVAGGAAFALSFDEIIVTTFTARRGKQTLPIWIFNNLRGQQSR